MRFWSCTVVCDYCKREEKTVGNIPKGWRTAIQEYVSIHSNLKEEQEYQSCNNLECIEKFKEHVESEGFRELLS
jgi:hypothetical protein